MHMDITPYVESLRRDLAAAAESGSEEIRNAAERLALALDPAARLALMEAISQAAAEITAEMPSGSVDVRLNGRELAFVVEGQAAHQAAAPSSPPPAADEIDEDGAVARITLRIPESIKVRAEEMAARSGHSLNTWLVNVIRSATTHDQAINVDIDLSSLPFFGDPFGRPGRGSKKMTGWI